MSYNLNKYKERSRQKVAQFDIAATLSKVPLLSSLGKSQKRQLAKELITKVYHNGQDIMREGQEGDFFLIIIDGKVDVKSSKGGHLAYLSEGDYAGEQALLKAQKRNATLTAVDTTTCLLCSKHTFDKIKKSVKFANRYAHTLHIYMRICVVYTIKSTQRRQEKACICNQCEQGRYENAKY